MRVRRDPRQDREARRQPGCARPRFALSLSWPAAGRIRREPRLLRRAATVATAPRLRIAWRGGVAPVTGEAALAARTPVEAVRIISEPAFHVLAVLDMADGLLGESDRQLLCAARSLADAGGGAVCAVTIGQDEDFGAAGADRVIAAPNIDPRAYDPEGRAAAVLAAMSTLSPRHVLFAETSEGGDVARRVSARCGERLFAGVEAIEDGRVVRRAHGGAQAQASEVPRLLTLSSDAFAVHQGPPHEARPLDALAIEPLERRIREGRGMQVDPDTVALAESDFLLSAGNGVTDWATFASLAEALGATRAGSRVVCDAGHLPRERQVGASGTLVTAKCYFALGISGAPQHLQGITRVGHVVAVNTDLHAEMIKRADLAIVADAQEVMPALHDLVARRRESADD